MPHTDDYDKHEEQRHQSDGVTHQKDFHKNFHPIQFILGLILIVACIVLIIIVITHPYLLVR